MPGNEVEDRLRSLFELSNSSPGLNTSQRVIVGRPVLNYKQQVSNQGQNREPLHFSLNNDNIPHSDSVKGNINQFLQVPFTQLNPRPEFSRHFSRSNLLDSNGYNHGHQNFQRWQNQGMCSDENPEIGWRNSASASADSPTLTTNSEKSEIAEASSDFSVLGWQQQLVRGQQFSTSQAPSMQQSGFNDMQILQQTIMFKQLQELQRKQQLQELGDPRQHKSVNHFSANAQQAAGGQLPILINGTPVRDSSSHVFMNLMQLSSSPAGQGVPNRMAFPQDQNQSIQGVSLHGTPVGSAGGMVNMQGMSHGLENPLDKAGSGNQTQKHIMPSTFGNPFPGNHDTFSSNSVCMSQGAFASKQGFPVKNAFGQVSPQHGNILNTNASLLGFNSRQEQVGNLETMQQNTTQLGPSQGLVPLDPLEQKILYNMDDNSWDTSFGRSMDLDAGGFGGALEQSDYSSALQSGSWSALMQTAVAEASSCDTGVQEEWSGLTFQSTELSTDNQPSKFMGEERQQPNLADSNLQNASSNSKPNLMLNDPSISSSFPGFQQSGFRSSNEHVESVHHYDSHKSFQKSPKSAGEWSDYNPQQKSSNQISQQIQPLAHLENTWAGPNDEQFGFSMNNNENVGGEETQHLSSSRNHIINNSYEVANIAYKNFNASYSSKGLSAPQQGHAGNSIVTDEMSKTTMNMNQGSLSDFHGNSKASEQAVLGGDFRSSSSTNFGQTVDSNGQNIASWTSQHMLELLHKVDGSRENSPMAHFSTTDHTSLPESPKIDAHDSYIASPKIDAHDSYIAQMLNRSSASQGFGLKLAPPSQRLPNSSFFLPQDYPLGASNVNPSPVNPEVGVKNQGWLDSSSPARSLPLNEFPQRTHWGEKSSNSGQTSVFTNLNMQALASGLPCVRSQLQAQHMNAPVRGESSQATLTDTCSRFNPSQDTHQQISTDPFGHQFPSFKTASLSQPSIMSHMSPKSVMSARLQNTWKNVPASQLSSAAPSTDPSKNCMETTSLASPKGRTVSSDLGDGSTSAQGSEYGEQPGIHMFRQELSSEIIDTLQSGGPSECQKSNQQDLDRVLHSVNHASAASERNLESLGGSLGASQTLHQNYTLLQQVQAMKSSAETDPSRTAMRRYNEAGSVTNIQQISDTARPQSIYEPNPGFSNQTLVGMDLPQRNSSPSEDPKMRIFLTDAREKLGGETLPRPVLQHLHGNGTFDQNESQNQTKGMVYNHSENPQVNLHMAPKQHGTFRNLHMQPMYDARLAKTTMELLNPGSVALPGQVGNISPSTTGSVVANENFSSLHVLPPDVLDRIRPNIRAKKHKSVGSERIPWHKEVTQGSERLQDISTAEQDWAYATNRLTEKVEDDSELIGEDQQMHHRSKRRVIRTTQLTQQLLRPAPASVLLGDASSRYDSVVYLTAKVALGDACSLAYGSKKDSHAVQGNNMISEKLKTFESDEHFTEVVEDFTDRAKKLENNFSRLESASFSDIRVDCQDLERYSVMNRFAKFHMRGQSGTSSSATTMIPPKSSPQKWVTALPIPRNLPEDAQCLSL